MYRVTAAMLQQYFVASIVVVVVAAVMFLFVGCLACWSNMARCTVFGVG